MAARQVSIDLFELDEEVLPTCDAKNCIKDGVGKFFLPMFSGELKIKYYCGAHAAQFIILRQETGL